jgi:hypothetical protein
MRIFPIAASTVAALLAVTLAGRVSAMGPGQESSAIQEQQVPQVHRHILGYQDSQTGAFQPLQVNVPEAVTAPIAGTITLTLHITLKTAVATGSKVACGAFVDATFSNTTGTTAYTETAYAFATISGTTATCAVSIPHSWQFPATTTTHVETLLGTYSAEIFNPTATTTGVPLSRSSSSGFVSLTGANIFATAPSAFSVNVTL